MEAAIFDDLTALADATRSRMLLLLERHELTVAELCAVLQLPAVDRQPAPEDAVRRAAGSSSRREGTSRYYTLALDDRGAADAAAVGAAARAGQRRPRAPIRTRGGCEACSRGGRRSRRSSSRRRRASGTSCARSCSAAPRTCRRCRRCSTSAGRSAISAAAPGRSRRRWRRSSRRVIAVDRSGDMLQAARRRLRELPNVDVRRGELEALPIEDGELDAATLLLVLHHLPDPVRRARRGGARAASRAAAC